MYGSPTTTTTTEDDRQGRMLWSHTMSAYSENTSLCLLQFEVFTRLCMSHSFYSFGVGPPEYGFLSESTQTVEGDSTSSINSQPLPKLMLHRNEECSPSFSFLFLEYLQRGSEVPTLLLTMDQLNAIVRLRPR